MDKKLLDILVCPVSGAALKLLDDHRRTALNERIRAGDLRYADGAVIKEPLAEALITADGATVYRIDDGIPVMLPDHAIAVEEQTA